MMFALYSFVYGSFENLGLRLFVTTDLAEYLDTTESAGVRLTITSKQEPIYPDAFGYNAQAGFTTSFALKFVRTTRLPAPFSNCMEQSPGQYSAETCFRECLQTHIAAVCGCQDPHFKLVTTPDSNTNVLCTYDKLDCVNNATRSGQGGTFEAKLCSCPPLCDEGVYTVTTTSSNWPSKAYQRTLCATSDGKIDCQDYHDNTMFVEMYFEALNYEVLTESEAYPLPSLISDFGGQIGLWIGVSVITVVEFLLLPFLMCSAMCKNKGRDIDCNSDGYDKFHNEFDRIGGSTWTNAEIVAMHNTHDHLAHLASNAAPDPYVGLNAKEYPKPPPISYH